MPRGPIVLIVAGGAAGLLVILLASLLVARCSGGASEGPRAGGEGAGSHAAVADEGMRAPGAAELRALGCEQALVVDMGRLLGAGRVREGEPHVMVTCDVAAGAEAPTCERAAATYFGAIGGSAMENVGVRVLRAGASAPLCSRLYAPSGADLGVFPRLPP